MPTRGFVTIQDYNGEITTTNFWVQDISALNYGSVTQDIDEVKDSIIDVVNGTVLESGFTKTFQESFADVTNADAQRERKWRVSYRDTTQFLDAANTIANPGYGKVFDFEIGTAAVKDGSGNSRLIAESDEADLTDTEIAALVVDIEANVRSPYNHSANAPTVEVLSIRHVGRNS